MSDTPEGPDWWRATDGRWYPPELFTGPPELRPGADRAAAAARSDEVGATSSTRPAPPDQPAGPAGPNRTVPLIAAAAVLLVAVGAWWVLARDDGGDAADEASAVAASTSTGPVRVTGTLRVDASVPLAAIAPRDCDGWSQLLRVQVLGPSGEVLTEFAPPPTEESAERTATRGDTTKDLECELRIAADVPAEGSYALVVRNVRDGGRPSLEQPVDGADRGEVGAGDLTLAYTCDSAGVCSLRPAT
jgi:hypothetical protein